MPRPNSRAQQTIQRRLDQRQELADKAIAALAHGRRNTDHLYAELCALEGVLETEHPHVVARNYGAWATRDAEQLALHQGETAPGCEHCTAANTEAELADLVRTA